jgi:predicted dehydrogenase
MELGVGIIGFGFMGRTHTYGLVNIPLYYDPLPFRVKHISVCTRSERNQAAARALGYYRRVVGDYRQLVDDPEIDVICVSTPNRAHKEQLLAAMTANKHIYCDKPVVASPEAADEVRAALPGYRGKSQVVLQYRFVPAVMRAKQLVEAGFLGRPFHYRGAYLHSSNIDPNKPLNWKSDKKRGGGGSMLDLVVHILDVTQNLVGDLF